MPDGMIQKERKKRIIKQTAMKAILVIILVCIAMITFLLLFQVRKIEVSGNQYLSRQEIADWVQDDNWSSNSLYVMIRNHLMNHELLPAMEEANVTMKNPWTVKVTTKEKRVAGYIVSGDECIYFDKDGIVLAKTKELWDGIPCIEGLEVKKVQLYKALPISKANKKAFGNCFIAGKQYRNFTAEIIYRYYGSRMGHDVFSKCKEHVLMLPAGIDGYDSQQKRKNHQYFFHVGDIRCFL